MVRACVVAWLVLAACGHRDDTTSTAAAGTLDPHQRASHAECVAYQHKLFELLPERDRARMIERGLDKPADKDLALCEQRMTAEVVRCALATTTMHDALACKPSIDPRPPEAKHSDDECARYIGHVRDIASAQGLAPDVVANLGQTAKVECGRWLSPERFACTLAAKTTQDWYGCPP